MKKTVDELPTFSKPAMKKIEDALEDLGDCWMWQREFVENYDLSIYAISRYARRFEDYRVACGRRFIWTGSKSVAKKLKEMC